MQNATFQTTIEVFCRTSQKNLVKMYIQNCISVQECTYFDTKELPSYMICHL